MMKKLASASLCLFLCAVLLTGCGTKLEADSSLVYVDKKGGVVSIDVDDLEADYYDAEELSIFVENEVDAYTEENGKDAVKLDDISVENGIAKMKMSYKTAADYSNFNGIELYQGKMVNALAAGYDFDVDFARIQEGVTVGSADRTEVLEQDELKVVVIRANTDVKIEGEILYVSSPNVKLTGKDSISIREGYSLLEGSETGEEERPSNESVNEGTEATEQVIQGTLGTEYEDEASGEQENGDTAGTDEPLNFGAGSFETEIYTYIVYK